MKTPLKLAPVQGVKKPPTNIKTSISYPVVKNKPEQLKLAPNEINVKPASPIQPGQKTEHEPVKELPIQKIELKVDIDKKVLVVQAQLYSARVFLRLKQFDKAKSFYLNVIKKEPKVRCFFKLILLIELLIDKLANRNKMLILN